MSEHSREANDMDEGFSVEAVLYAMAKRSLADAKVVDFRIFILKELLEHMDFRMPRMSLEERVLFEKFVKRVLLDIMVGMHRPLLILHIVHTLNVAISKIAETLGAKKGGD